MKKNTTHYMPTNHDNVKTKELLTKSFLKEGPGHYWVGGDSKDSKTGTTTTKTVRTSIVEK